MRTTISSKGQVVLPAELRQQDRIAPGQQFEIQRIRHGEYLLKKLSPPPGGVVLRCDHNMVAHCVQVASAERARIRRGLLTVRGADGPPVGHPRSVRNVIEYRALFAGGMWCCHVVRASPART